MAMSCCCLQRISGSSIQAILLGIVVITLICVSVILEAFNRPIWHHSNKDKNYHLNIVDVVNNKTTLWLAEYNPFASRALSHHISYVHESKSPAVHALNKAYIKAFDNETLETTLDHWNSVLNNPIKVPDRFDSREAWPHCWTIHHISDQAGCGSCWAMAAVGTMSDRICIASNGTIQPLVSAQDVIECCPYCGGCMGNLLPLGPFLYWQEEGLVSGGNYGSMDGCKPYSMRPDCGRPCPVSKYLNAKSPKCKRECQPLHFPSSYNQNKIKGSSSYWLDHSGAPPPDVKDYMKLTDFQNVVKGMNRLDKELVSLKGQKAELLCKEIMIHGPFTACFPVAEDIQHYKSGIYRYTTGKIMYSHCIKIIGWGEDGDNKYWLAANTWGRSWGENGFLRISRGTSETLSISMHVYDHGTEEKELPGVARFRPNGYGEDIFAGLPDV